MLKKYFSLILSVLICLTLPNAVSAAGSTASAYDVYISGNFVPGETLTANYTYYDPNGCAEAADTVEYTWYTFQNNNNGSVTVLGTGRTYTLDTTYQNAYEVAGRNNNFIVGVKTTNQNGQGKEVFSNVYTPLLKSNAAKPVARSAYIAPKNAAGTMELGDTVVAHFRYANGSGTDKAEGAHRYTWYVRDRLNSTERTLVQAQSTDNTYTIGDAARGKYIECDIMPVSGNGVKGEIITARNHYGNLFYGDVDFSCTGALQWKLPFSKSNYPSFSYAHLMADSQTLITAEAGSMLMSTSASNPSGGTTVFDLKDSKSFDGFYFSLKQNGTNDTADNSRLNNVTLAYSNDNTNWTEADVSGLNGFGSYEILLPATATARYVKFFTTGAAKTVYLADLYPFTTDRFLPKLMLNGAETITLLEGESYTDPGFTAQDANGNDVSSSVVVGGDTVNTSSTGTYIITYTLNLAGSPEVKVTRKVVVESRAAYEAAQQQVREAQAALELPFDTNAVYANVTLPDTAANGISITWSSNKPAVLSSGGVVKRGSENMTVKLTATLSNSALTLTKDFDVVVVKKSTPVLLDVYISGNLTEGETITAEYLYQNANGLAADENAMLYQWYRKNDFNNNNSGEISGATQKSYTLTSADIGYNFFVAVTPVAADGEKGSQAWSAMSGTVNSRSTQDAPAISAGYITSVSSDKTMLVGDKLRVHYTYIERGGSPEGTPSFIWQTRKTAEDTPTVVQKKSADDTYTLQTDDFGKIIECIVTTESSSGEPSETLTVRNHYGNVFIGDDIKAVTGTNAAGKPMAYDYYGCALPGYRVVAHEGAGYLYTYKNTEGTTEAGLTYDVGRLMDFNAFYISVGGCKMTNINLQYSINGSDYIDVPLTETSTTGSLTVNLDKVIQARYFRLGGNPTGGYMKLNAFYPYLSVSAASALSLTDGETMAVKQYSVFSDPGFTAADPYGNDASANVLVTGSVDTQRLGTYPLTYTLTCAGYPSLTQTRTVTVVKGIAQDGDLAFEKHLTENGSAVSALTDGNEFTSETLAAGEHTFILDLGSVAGVDEIKALADNGAAYALTAYGSEDETVWKTLGSSATGGDVTFTPTEVRYIKLVLTLAAQTDINSIEAYLSDAGKVQLAAEGLILPQSTTVDLALATSGKYGTQISWSSDKPGVIGTEGAVTRGQTDEIITLTANITCNAAQTSKVFTVTVVAYSSGGIYSGAPAGGGSGLFNSAKLDVSASTQTPTLKSAFADVDGTHWAFEYIVSLYKAGLISGRSEDSFVPDGEITRAEFLKLLLTAFYPDSVQCSCNFTDVSENDWFYSYIAKAQTIGLTNGYEDGSFCPNDPILRRDIAVFIERLLEITGRELEKAEGQTLADFDTVAAYAQNAVSYLVSAGIISGNDRGEFLPDKNTTRAETAKMIYLVRQALQEVVK